MSKKIICLILAIGVAISLLACGDDKSELYECSVDGCTEQVYKNGLCPDHYVEINGELDVNDAEEKTIEKERKEAAYKVSTTENDTDIGLKNIKFDTAKGDLSNTEKLVAEYFNKDYLFVNSIEALQRYNKIFDGSLIQSYVYIDKVISYEGDDYKLLVYLINNSNELAYEYTGETFAMPSRRMIISGTTGDSRFIEGDIIQINGRYLGVTTETVDGESITVPNINVYKAYMYDPNDEAGWWYVETPSRFDKLQVKEIAKCIFGDNITIRNDEPADYGVESEDYYGSDIENYNGPCYVCELDNQSNAKFSKYFFNERYGTMTDAVHDNYELSFSGDFKHFYLFMYDGGMETLTLEYYDNNLNKIWKREFENTSSASYDVTKNNIYLVANNEFYVINTETGEDTFASTYIGDKLDIRKFENGVLTISDKKADAFMYMGLDGNVLWRADANDDIPEYSFIQAQEINDRIVLSIESYGSSYYYVIDKNDGTIIYSGSVDTPNFRQYG
ncbi:MAG: hypothetical protein HDR20_08020 [Lachnospiraceae bacterium]|nr:hypothetical protein [Lachnospiraceae bacterium]